MRLPADATLIVLEMRGAANHEMAGAGSLSEANVAALVAAWRTEKLPLVRAFPLAPGDAGQALVEGEFVLAASGDSGFDGAALESLLDEIGATTLVLCGEAASVTATARDAAALGYQVFVVVDACPSPDDLRGGPAGSAQASRFSPLSPEIATLVDAAATLGAAATAKARQRRHAERSRQGG
jgi:hypothetical protein